MIIASRPPRALLAAGAVTAVIALIPIGYIALRAVDAGWGRVTEVLWRQRTLETVVTSVGLVVAVTTACLAIGIPTAWLVARSRLPLRRMWLVAVALPLALPSYVVAYAWISLIPGFSGFWAAVLVLTSVSTPYIVLPTAAALRMADPAMEDVARSLGRRPFAAFRLATGPQVWPAAAAGALLVALYTLSDFGAVALLRVDAFTRVIFAAYRGSFDRVSAATLAIILVIFALLLVLLERQVRGRGARWRTSSDVARSAVPVRLSHAWTIVSLLSLGVITVVGLVIPIYSLLERFVQGARGGINLAEIGLATINSFGASLLGALVAVTLALPVGILAARYTTRSVRFIESSSFIGHALPAIVVGLSLVLFTLNVVPVLYQTLAALALAYAVIFLPKSLGSTRTAIAGVPPVLEDTARSLGRGPMRAWAATTLRSALPGITAGGVLVLLTAMKELPATLIMRPTGFDTLATELWSRTEIAAYGAAAPYALALVLLAALPAWLLSRTMGVT